MWRRLPSRRWCDGHCGAQCGAPSARAGRVMQSTLNTWVSAGTVASGASVRSEPVASASPHYIQPLLKSPFHNRARALSQVDSFIPWAGYTTVDVFTSVEQEYFAIRNGTTLYDLTPMV